MKTVKPYALLLAAAALFACHPENKPEDGGNEEDGGNVQQPTELTPTADHFYKGTTMSFASYLLDEGLVYRENGLPADPYKSIKDHGANIVRLQLNMVDFDKIEGKTIDWASYGRVLADAKKAKAQGMDIFLTLKPDADRYSSSATHHNMIPEEWASKDDTQLGTAIYDWTLATLSSLADAGIKPKIIAVGNEVNLGFMRRNASDIIDPSRDAKLLARGFEAVRAYAAKYDSNCLCAVHVANPSRAEYFSTILKGAGANDYDVLALSYYPGKNIGHTMSFASFEAMAKAFRNNGKLLMVIETAHSFTVGKGADGKWLGDNCNNAYNYPDWDDATNAENYTPARQRAWLKELAEDIKRGGGIGLITWGTESLPDLVEGGNHVFGFYIYPASWGRGSTWENNSYWDFTDNNNLHQGIDWMKDVDSTL